MSERSEEKENQERNLVGYIETVWQEIESDPDAQARLEYFIGEFPRLTPKQRAKLAVIKERQATEDPLTRILNRRAVEEELGIEIERATAGKKRKGGKLSVLFIDIDDFKKINDTYGHFSGDKVLIELTQVISANTRDGDRIGRWGGEEFVVILPGADSERAEEIAEQIRSSVEEQREARLKEKQLGTVSVGVYQWHQGQKLNEVIENADRLMYKAKESRNKVHSLAKA